MYHSAPDPQALSKVHLALAYLPMCMENPMHWKAIADVARRIYSGGAHVARWYDKNKGWINPILSGIGTVAALV